MVTPPYCSMRSLLLNMGGGGDGSFGTTGASFLGGMIGVGGSTVIVVLMLGMGILTVVKGARSLRGGLTGSLGFGISGAMTGCIGCEGGVGSTTGSGIGALISSIGVGVTALNMGNGSADAILPIIGTDVATTGSVSGVTGSSGIFSFSGGPRSLWRLLRLRPRAMLDDRLRMFRVSY